MDTIVNAHKVSKTFTEVVIYPEHAKRTVSKEFKRTKDRLKNDGHHKCWVCGTIEDLEVHHMGCEWALEGNVDYDKLKAFGELFDPYGYGVRMRDMPVTTVDDIRNCLVLCEKHHRHPMEGIHNITFPIWISQKISKDGQDPIPENE